MDAAFPFVDSLAALERISDHCSNVAVYMLGYLRGIDEVDRHAYIMELHSGRVDRYNTLYSRYSEKYYDKIRAEAARA